MEVVKELAYIIKDTALVMMIALTLDKIRRGGKVVWLRAILIAILFLL